MNAKSAILGVMASAAMLLTAEPSGDRPNDSHAWAVHDVNRPDPVKVAAAPGKPPSDAIVLFDGTEESIARNWRDGKGNPTKWTVKDGAFVCTPGSGGAFTAEEFGDCQLHVEWKTPKDDLYGWGNSGVIFMGRYEIQILDSSDVRPSRSPWKPANYADGQAGAVYGQNPPLVQPCRAADEWQTYDIVFHPPLYDGKRLVDPGSVTVFFNGVLVHPVPFRNIWIRRIPSRYADTVNGGIGLKRGDVAELRHRLAAESLAFAEEAKDPAERFIRLWESYCYEPDRAVKARFAAAEKECLSALAEGRGDLSVPERFHAFKRFVDMLVRTGWMPGDAAIKKALDKSQKPPKPTAPNMRDI